ncbi:hypothetical protein CMZ82_13495 [Lysobacteraceae bacterium NML93-0792]|nr:hypothetical protein CMZ82_13495 [Xanthomonadaceae bacterium NML93-0792]PBS17235.1 hypothetical protein CMZ81_00010 [Xanthomonadaceae bacterium NML93-0793]PBS20436.1 hypothetical protein CMZ80_00840 [Xanthomonadaceae bacterium NML93-0831]
MSKFEELSDKAMSLVGQAGDSLRHAIPATAENWLKTGVAVGAARTGAKVGVGFLRRNPAIVAASAIGVGLVWVAARQYRKKKANETIEGNSRRIEASNAAARKRATRSKRGASTAANEADAN